MVPLHIVRFGCQNFVGSCISSLIFWLQRQHLMLFLLVGSISVNTVAWQGSSYGEEKKNGALQSDTGDVAQKQWQFHHWLTRLGLALPPAQLYAADPKQDQWSEEAISVFRHIGCKKPRRMNFQDHSINVFFI